VFLLTYFGYDGLKIKTAMPGTPGMAVVLINIVCCKATAD
jgi:hypothetical protein